LRGLCELCDNGCMADKQLLSEEARRNFGALLGEVQYQGVHVTVMRYKTPAAVIVPPDWYARAVEALAASNPEHPPG
jgi:PHD/YefM family antitoxin component YafN of YafNO toxin-antitoxin module